MNGFPDRRWKNAGAWLLALSVGAFGALQLRLGLHSDDVGIIKLASEHGYSDVWTSPMMRFFYRPIVVTLVKLSSEFFASPALPLRALQGALIAACVLSLVTLFRPRPGTLATTLGGLCLLASPFTFVAVGPFAVGIADSIVALALLLCVRLSFREQATQASQASAVFVLLSLVAVLSKESGLLVVAFCVLESVRRRKLVAIAALLALGVGYLALRAEFVESRSFVFRAGLGFAMLKPAELQARFGESPYGFYVYNVVASEVSLLTYLPKHGQFRLSPPLGLLAVTTCLTTFLTARYVVLSAVYRRYASLLLLIPLNALFGYAYVRERIMFVGATVIAVFFMLAVDDLSNRRQTVLGGDSRWWVRAAIVAWLAVLVSSLVRVWRQAN